MSRLRMFLAVDLGPAIRTRLASLQEELAADSPTVKWVEPENRHITLMFLGDVESRQTAYICRAAQKVTAKFSAFMATIEGVGCFPNARRPRVVWVGLGEGSEELCAVHDALQTMLEDMGCYRRETRAYKPHVTLGRVTGEEEREALAQALVKYKTWSAGEVRVREVCIMSSELKSDGPDYTVLGRAKLKGGD